MLINLIKMFNENLESIVEEYIINQCDKLKINSRDIKKGEELTLKYTIYRVDKSK